MEIFLNGEARTVNENCTIAVLINQLDLQNKRLAVEVNFQIIPRSQFDKYTLAAGDKVEIVHAIGGG
jgi:thiamine biosynthesis protein ThiS